MAGNSETWIQKFGIGSIVAAMAFLVTLASLFVTIISFAVRMDARNGTQDEEIAALVTRVDALKSDEDIISRHIEASAKELRAEAKLRDDTLRTEIKSNDKALRELMAAMQSKMDARFEGIARDMSDIKGSLKSMDVNLSWITRQQEQRGSPQNPHTP